MHFGVKGTEQRRFDIVGFRDDGAHFRRFHPGSGGETWPIAGNLQLWAIEDSGLAIMPERLLQRVPMGSARPAPLPAASQEYLFSEARPSTTRSATRTGSSLCSSGRRLGKRPLPRASPTSLGRTSRTV